MDELQILSSTILLDQTTLPTRHQPSPKDRVSKTDGGGATCCGHCRCTTLRSCTLTSGSSAGRAFLHVEHALPPAATNSCRHLWSALCPHGSVTGSSSTSKHTAQLQSSGISGLRARLCPALLEAAALLSVLCPPGAGLAAGTRAAPLALPGKLAEGCGTAHRRRGGFMSVCAGGVRELPQLYDTGLRYDASALSGSGM
jgi:hypothetical protein